MTAALLMFGMQICAMAMTFCCGLSIRRPHPFLTSWRAMSTTYTTKYVCDVCQKTASTSRTPQEPAGAPAGWLHGSRTYHPATANVSPTSMNDLHVCSVQCAAVLGERTFAFASLDPKAPLKGVSLYLFRTTPPETP